MFTEKPQEIVDSLSEQRGMIIESDEGSGMDRAKFNNLKAVFNMRNRGK